MRKKKVFMIILIDSMVLLFLLLASSTNLILKEPIPKSYKITVLLDLVTEESDENFKMGLNKGAVAWNMDVNLNYISDYQNIEGIQALLQKEINNGSAGLILNCKNDEMAKAIVSVTPVGMPVVLWDMELESPRVRGSVSNDKEEELNLMVEAIMAGRTQGQDVAFVERSGGCPQARAFHQKLGKRLTAQGVVVREVKLEELSSTNTLIKGMALQKKNIIVSADFIVLKALAKSCNDSKITMPLYGVGGGLGVRNLLEEGYISALVVHRSYEAGYLALGKVSEMIQKVDTKKESILVENILVTPENMYERDIETFIFPYT